MVTLSANIVFMKKGRLNLVSRVYLYAVPRWMLHSLSHDSRLNTRMLFTSLTSERLLLVAACFGVYLSIGSDRMADP